MNASKITGVSKKGWQYLQFLWMIGSTRPYGQRQGFPYWSLEAAYVNDIYDEGDFYALGLTNQGDGWGPM